MPGKLAILNLELGRPSGDASVSKMKNTLLTYKGQGVKAVILIHGYGSGGEGGVIRERVRIALVGSDMRGIVRAFAPGEQWAAKKREFIGMCKALEKEERQIANNQGVTVVILR
jgi:hypothetical protein